MRASRLKHPLLQVLDCPIFRTRTSASPYPPDMATVEAAYFYSAWNQGIAAVRMLRAFPNPNLTETRVLLAPHLATRRHCGAHHRPS